MSATAPVAAAIYSALAADTGPGGLLAASSPLVTGVFNSVPAGQAYPYVVIGQGTEQKWHTFDNRGKELTRTIHVWSDYPGDKQALAIADRVEAILDRASLIVSGWRVVSCEEEYREPMDDPDGIRRHVVLRYRLRVEKA